MSEPEKFVVIWFDENNDVYTVTDGDDNIIEREYDALKSDVHGVLSTEEEIEDATADVRYAVPVDLAREVFGWDL